MRGSMKEQVIEKSADVLPVEIIQSKIYFIRGHKVMLDSDLAILYGVETGHLNRAVKRNRDHFPEDFMFQLSKEEEDYLRCQIGMSKIGRGGQRYLSYVFTEQGVAMLSSVLRSKRAVQVNIQIMRVFVKLKEIMISHKDLARKIEALEGNYQDHDKKIQAIFEAIRRLIVIPVTDDYKRTRVGFKVDAK